MGSDDLRERVAAAHARCPGMWCTAIVCERCGELLTNPKPEGDGLVGICPIEGRGAKGVMTRRVDCLAAPSSEGADHG